MHIEIHIRVMFLQFIVAYERQIMVLKFTEGNSLIFSGLASRMLIDLNKISRLWKSSNTAQ